MAIAVFLAFVALVLWLSTFAGRRSRSAGGYFVANSTVHWGVNGVAFAGGYLSVASFLGICGLIAFFGYDGFLYSIGFLAGWLVALFVIAEPMKRMGIFTFSDALNRNFKHPGIHLAAGVSVLVVSIFYLVPQMVGAGVLVEPLLGIPHYWGVILVGSVVIVIVAIGGMTSTTYVQFFNGGLLLLFAGVLTVAVLARGVSTGARGLEEGGARLPAYRPQTLSLEGNHEPPRVIAPGGASGGSSADTGGYAAGGTPEIEVTGRHGVLDPYTGRESVVLYRLSRWLPAQPSGGAEFTVLLKGRTLRVSAGPAPSGGADGWAVVEHEGRSYVRISDWWRLDTLPDGSRALVETQSHTVRGDGVVLVNGAPEGPANRLRQMGGVTQLPAAYGGETGPLGPFRLLSVMADRGTIVQRPLSAVFTTPEGERVTVHYEQATRGSVFMRPGLMFPLEPREGEPALVTFLNRLNFISLMLALFLGTAALPHILIRYYTVPSAEAARKSTIVAITGIGLFYLFTMYMGVGAVASGALNPETSNMSAPLLARSFGEVLFAMISAIAFTTVLATVSGLIMAASGAVAHDLMGRLRRQVSDAGKVRTARVVAVGVGLVGIVLGIAFRGMNVSFLVGWAFAVAASANLPALILMLFWKKTTAQGIIASILVGVGASVALILLSPDMYARYGLDPASAPMPINQPGVFSIPLSFLVLVLVSLATQNRGLPAREAAGKPAGPQVP